LEASTKVGLKHLKTSSEEVDCLLSLKRWPDSWVLRRILKHVNLETSIEAVFWGWKKRLVHGRGHPASTPFD
jgi:hypothetical protein